MTREFVHKPLLDKFYQDFLRSERSADFVESVSQHYCIDTLADLSVWGSRVTRRAAVLALGFLGDFGVLEPMGRAMHDADRAVRMLADHGLRQLWFRQGTESEQAICRRLARLNLRGRHEEAAELADLAIRENDLLAEAWNQRAVALYALSEFDAAVACNQETLYLNRYHFLAAVGMANCHLQLDSVSAALESFRLALSINPDLESVRGQILHLQKIMDD